MTQKQVQRETEREGPFYLEPSTEENKFVFALLRFQRKGEKKRE